MMFSYAGGAVLVAWFLFRVRGRRAWAPLLGLVLLWIVAWLTGSVLAALA